MSDQRQHARRVSRRRLRSASDERLVAALRRGDQRAFELIYDRYHRALLGFCQHMLGSREEAEDALQQVFVAAHQDLLGGNRRIDLKPWLYTIARNRCLSMLRARQDTCPFESAGEARVDGPAVAEEVERREEFEELIADLTRLPDEQRAALLLSALGDLSQREIAATLDVRTEKVKALVFQARQALGGWREARATGCAEIQEELATVRGAALRHRRIQRHLAVCAPCAAFKREVARHRAGLGLLPVIPSAGLKHSVLSAALCAGDGAGVTASGVGVKTLAVTLAIGAGGGGVVAVGEPGPSRARETARGPARAAVATVAPAATSASFAQRRVALTWPSHSRAASGSRSTEGTSVGRPEPATRSTGEPSKGKRSTGKPPKETPHEVKAPEATSPSAKINPPKLEAPKLNAPKVKAPKLKAPKVKAPKAEVEAPKAKAPRANGNAPNETVAKEKANPKPPGKAHKETAPTAKAPKPKAPKEAPASTHPASKAPKQESPEAPPSTGQDGKAPKDKAPAGKPKG